MNISYSSYVTCMNQKHVLVRGTFGQNVIRNGDWDNPFHSLSLCMKGVLFVRWLRTAPGFSSSTSALAKAYAKADWCLGFFRTKMARKITAFPKLELSPRHSQSTHLGRPVHVQNPQPFGSPWNERHDKCHGYHRYISPWDKMISSHSFEERDFQHGQLWTRDIQPSLTNIFCTKTSEKHLLCIWKKFQSDRQICGGFSLQKLLPHSIPMVTWKTTKLLATCGSGGENGIAQIRWHQLSSFQVFTYSDGHTNEKDYSMSEEMWSC